VRQYEANNDQTLNALPKIIILFLLLITSLYSEAKIYIGVDVGYFNESFADSTSGDGTNSEMGRFKIGYGERTAYAIEFSLDYINNKSTTFSTNTQPDGNKYALNVELVKAFDFDLFMLPFFKFGYGAGFLDVHGVVNGDTIPQPVNSLHFSSYNFGLGTFIPLNEHFDIEIAYEFQSLSYEKSDKTDTLQNRLSSNTNIAFIGFNLRF